MTKNISQLTLLSLLAVALIAVPPVSRAQDSGATAPAAPDQTAPAKPKKHHPPFNGKLAAVDLAAKTLTVGKLTLQVTADTKITKDGKPATLGDGVVGEPVSGAYHKTAEGKLDATTIHFGVKPKKEASGTGVNN
ncbi:MAG: hypothetical protein WAO02_14560 [Verrucomicrobiia bacterium]